MTATSLIRPVILCGGGGTRLWPLSTDRRPKQFLSLTGPRPMVTETAARVADPAMFSAPLIIGSLRHADELRGALPGARFLLEPMGRNSAAAIAASVLLSDSEEIILALPADHHIRNVPAFVAAVRAALPAAEAGKIVTFGITPEYAATGYGYIEAGAETPGEPTRPVQRFVEKPKQETAALYVASGRHYWNAGIFMYRARTMEAALQQHAPDILDNVRQALSAGGELDPLVFAQVRNQSIDYAVMEHADNIVVAPASIGWSDLGDHRALHALAAETAANGNVFSGPVAATDTRDCFARSEGPVIALHGVSNLTVVATPEAVLVTPLDQKTPIRDVVAAAKDFAPARLPVPLRERIGRWLYQGCLPGWAERAWDSENGGFVESLTVAGEPETDLPRRGRVASRQVFAFARAKLAGWNPGGIADDLVARGLAYLDGPARSPKGGWAHVLSPDGAVADGRRDFYDHCFLAMAGAEALAAGHSSGRALTEEVWETIDALFADRANGGWRDIETRPTVSKLANPHMHMLEAALILHSATNDPAALARAETVASLFETHMFDPATGAMMETFGPDWTRIYEPHIEPGHCYEWASLLRELETRSGRDTGSWRRRLIRFSERSVLENGFTVDYLTPDGPGQPVTMRLWPQLERLRALLHHPEIPSEPAPLLESIFERYLDPGCAWTWIDRLDGDLAPAAASAPASMLYHFMTDLAPVAIRPDA